MAYGPGPFSQYGSSGTQAYGQNNGPMGYGNGYFGSPWGFMGGYGGTPTGSETSKPGIGNNRGIMTPPIQRLPGSPGQPGQPGTGTGTGGGYASPPIGTAPGPGTGTQAPGGPVMAGGQPPTLGRHRAARARLPDTAGTNCRGLRGITTTAAAARSVRQRCQQAQRWPSGAVTGNRGGGGRSGGLTGSQSGKLGGGNPPHLQNHRPNHRCEPTDPGAAELPGRLLSIRERARSCDRRP